MRLFSHKTKLGREGGYMMLILMFFVAMLAFAMMATLPRTIQQVKRDREEEMIHRGTEYARAIKKFYKKFNRYPSDVKELENTNNIRFIRRRYKDPMSKDGAWKLLHITDVQQGISNPNFGLSQANNFSPTGPGGPGGPGGLGSPINIGGSPTAVQGGLLSGNPGDVSQGLSPTAVQPPAPGAVQIGPQNPATGSPDASAPGGTSTSTPGGPGPTGGLPGQTYGAGGIVGVQSMSKAKSIREFDNKKNYNKWMFIYDPTQDRGTTLLKGPYDPHAFQGQGAQGANGANPAGLPGQPNGFGPQPPQNNAPGNQMPPDMNAPPQ